jgi:phosphotransacetylase
MRRRTTLIGAMLVKKGEADGMICGTVSTTAAHLRYIDQVIGGTNCVYAAMNGLVLPGRQIFLVDTHVNVDPTAEQLAEITIMAAEELKRFGIEPKVGCCRTRTSVRRSAVGTQDARHAEDPARPRAGPRGGWRNAWRQRARRKAARFAGAG